MNIDRCCDEPCCTDAGTSTATQAGIEMVREALDLLCRPDIVTYTDIVDAFTVKNASGGRRTVVPFTHSRRRRDWYTKRFQEYLDVGCDITCDCVLRSVLQKCGYVAGESGEYVRGAR
jgi:hypothetical protein